jgi:hypothetical protein
VRSKYFLLLVHLRDRLSADGRLDDLLHVARVEAVARAGAAVGDDLDLRRSQRVEHAQILHAGDSAHHVHDGLGVALVGLEIRPDHLDRILALHAAHGLFHVVADHLREVEDHAGERAGELLVQLVGELILRLAALPLSERRERGEQLHVVEAGHVRAVVGPAELRDHGEDLGVLAVLVGARDARVLGTAAQDGAHAAHVLGRLLQRDARGHGGADPEIALLQLGHELAAEEREQEEHRGDGQEREHHGDERPLERRVEERVVDLLERADDHALLLLVILLHEAPREHGSQGQRHEDGAADREGVRVRHRREDDAGDAGHREQGEERDADDERRERHGARDLARGREHALRHAALSVAAQVVEHVLHHDDGGVHDDAEVHRSDGDEVRGGLREHHAGEGDHQRDGDVERGDERGARVAEEEPQDQGHEQHAHDDVLDHRVRRDLHELAAVVVLLDALPGRQDAVLLDLLDPLVNALQRGLGLAAVAHQDGALHHLGIVVAPHDAEPRRRPDRHVGHLLEADGRAALGGEHDVLDVAEVVQEAHAAHVVALLADGEALSADVLVGVGDGLEQRVERHVVGLEPERVDVHVVLLGGAAEAHHVDDAVHLLELALQHPVLGGVEIHGVEALAAHGVAVHLADGVPRGDRGLHAVRELHHLEPVEHLLASVLVRDSPLEIRLHVGQAEQRLRPHVLQPGHAREADLQGDGDVALHLLRARALGLGDHLDQRRHRVRVRLDVEVRIGDDAPDHDRHGERIDDHGRPQRGRDELLDHVRWS